MFAIYFVVRFAATWKVRISGTHFIFGTHCKDYDIEEKTNMLVWATFKTYTITKSPKLTGVFLCNNCVYHKLGYIIPCSSFSLKLATGKTVSWTYKLFLCDSKDVIYILISKTCNNFHLGKLNISSKESQNKSDVKNLQNSFSWICSEQLRDCNQTKLYFQMFTMYHEANTALREYKKKTKIIKLIIFNWQMCAFKVTFVNKLINCFMYNL